MDYSLLLAIEAVEDKGEVTDKDLFNSIIYSNTSQLRHNYNSFTTTRSKGMNQNVEQSNNNMK